MIEHNITAVELPMIIVGWSLAVMAVLGMIFSALMLIGCIKEVWIDLFKNSSKESGS